ncbi:MAG: efflux RND transporter permease subunit [Candidatus Eiseniibacteriota bacterium]|jgi:multidrug efflux pump subunit AcrB
MSLTALAIDKNRITLAALLVLLAAGIGAFNTLPRAEDPGFIIRTALVTTLFPGASPERVELLVTDKIEKVVQEIPELDYVTSESKTGVSSVYVNIKESYTEMRPIWDDLRRKVERVRSQLPEEVIGPNVNDEFGDVFGTIVAVTGDGFSYVELEQVAEEVRDELLLIEEVAKVEIYGDQEERIFVEYSNARLAELGLSTIQLRQILESRNIVIPGGAVDVGQERIVLEPSGNFESVDDIRRSIVQLPGRRDVLYLQDIADVRRGYVDPPQALMSYSGRPALGLAISMREGGNLIVLGEKVRAAIRRLEQVYPIGVSFDFVAFQPDVVDRKVKDFVVSLVQAIVIVLLVMLVALGLRTGLVVASLIPMAMIVTLFVMSLFGIGIDQMSLASLIIALGLLVDNAIVMAESIMVRMREGMEPVQAAIASAAELRVPLLIASLTTAAAFLPIYLAESSTGEYTAPLFKVVTITLLCSWLLALTMTPLLCVHFLRVKPLAAGESFGSAFYRGYRRALGAVLRRRWLSLVITVAVFFLALQGFRLIPSIFFPPSDKAMCTAELRFPPGTGIERNRVVVAGIERFLGEELTTGARGERAAAGDAGDGAAAGDDAAGDVARDAGGIIDWAAFIGEGAPRYVLNYSPEPPGTDYTYMLINTDSRATVDRLIPRLEHFCLEHFPDLDPVVQPLELGPPVAAPVQVRLSARQDALLFDLVDAVKARLRETPGTRGITDDWGPRTKKLVVSIDQARARRAGVTNQDIALSLQTGLSGFRSSEYREGDDLIPIVLRSVAADRHDLGKLESLNVSSQVTGRPVPLKQVADISVAWEPAKIYRRNRLRTVTVDAWTDPGVTASDVVGRLVPWLDTERATWPTGAGYELGGEIETSVESQQSIAAKLPIAALLVVLLLVGQFNSMRRALIVLLTIPLGIIGVVIGLLVARSYFGFMTLLAVISLAGIVINNAIVLLDRIRIEIEENGLSPQRAVIESAQRRLRPILLTTCTTVGGLLPLWFGGGPMWEPMAIGIIFGLLFATLLTLGVVPVLYSILFRVDFAGFDNDREPAGGTS